MASKDAGQDFILHKLQQQGRSPWLGVKSDFLDWHCQANGRFVPMPSPHWGSPWTRPLGGTAEGQKGLRRCQGRMFSGCPWTDSPLSFVLLSTAQYDEKEGSRDGDEWDRIAGVLYPSPSQDSVLWHFPILSCHSWGMNPGWLLPGLPGGGGHHIWELSYMVSFPRPWNNY